MSTQLSVNEQEKKKNPFARHPVLWSVIAGVLVVAIVLGVIFVPTAVKNYEIKKQELTAVGTCAGYDIPYEELRFVAYNYRNHLEKLHGTGIWDSPTSAAQYAEELETLVVNNLNSTYAVYALCKELGVPVDSDEANDYVKSKMKELKNSKDFGGDSKKFKEWLKQNYMTEHLLEETLRSAYLESAALAAMIESGEQIKYSSDNLSAFLDYVETSPDYARTLHVYIANGEGKSQPTDKALRRAQEICDALRAKTDLDSRFGLLCQYIQTDSNDYSMTTTDGYYFTKDEMEADYEEAAFALAIGDVSEPLVTDDGVYVIMRLAPESKYIMANHTTLLQNYQGAVLGQTIEAHREKNPATLNEYGKSLTLWELE